MLEALLITFIVLFSVTTFLAFCFLFGLVQSQKDLRNSKARYLALEEGMDEQQESFEAEYLVWNDQKNSFVADIIVLQRIAEHHADKCIPDYAPILDLESYTTLERHSDLPSKYYDRIQELVLE